MVATFAKIGLGQWFRILTGSLEVAGAIGLFVPRCAVYAASMLAVVMLGAIGFHFTRLGGNPVAPIVLLLLVVMIVWLGMSPSRSEAQSVGTRRRVVRPKP